MQVALIDFLDASCNHYHMSEEKFPSQLAERFQIRMPDGLRDMVRVSAEANSRSMNAEIVYRLQEAYAMEELRKYKPSKNPIEFPDGDFVWVDTGPPVEDVKRDIAAEKTALEQARQEIERDRDSIKLITEDIKAYREQLRLLQNELAEQIYKQRRENLAKDREEK